MWRTARRFKNGPLRLSRCERFYATSSPTNSGKGSKAIIGLVATAGLGVTGAVVYGKYDPKFKRVLEDNIPYINNVYNWLPDWDRKSSNVTKESKVEEKNKESAFETGLIKRRQERLKSQEPQRPIETIVKPSTSKPKDSNVFEESIVTKNADADGISSKVNQTEIITAETTVNENVLNDMIQKLEKSSQDAVAAHVAAVKAIKDHTRKLYYALDVPEGNEGDKVWKEANVAATNKDSALNVATQKASDARSVLEKLKLEILKGIEKDAKNPAIQSGERILSNVSQQLQNSEAEVAAAQAESKTAAEYKDLIYKSKEQFRKELQIVLPKYVNEGKDKIVTEDELNLLIAHAHRRIEQLQKQLAKQQIGEKSRVEEAVNNQKLEDERTVDSKIEMEMERRKYDLENALHSRVTSLKEEFEVELRRQLRRQAAAHADHLQEVLNVQHQELDRKHALELEEKLLHQKGVFISEVSGNMARLKGILAYMKAKSEFDASSRKAQALWLASQAMISAISAGKFNIPSPLAKEVAAIKIAADEESEFVSAVLAGIPAKAVNRGVFTDETLKQRFNDVKKVCRKVAMIDENGGSLYKYFLSYLQSFLIVDALSIPKAELEGKVAVNPSEWDTFDILSRVSYCLKIDDMEQALRYANQLKGEPRLVAKDWMDEVRLLIETKLAVKALLAHAAAIGVQAYH